MEAKKIIITGGLGYIGMELSKIYSGKSRNFDISNNKRLNRFND